MLHSKGRGFEELSLQNNPVQVQYSKRGGGGGGGGLDIAV